MLRIFGPDNKHCQSGNCLKRDGELGMLPRLSGYFAMTQDAADGGRLYGLLDNGGSFPPCASGCVLHEVDIAGRVLNRTADVCQAYENKNVWLAHTPANVSVLLGGKLRNEEKYEVCKMVW